MSFKVYCEICNKEIKDVIVWVDCRFWNSHPITECNGGCLYPIGRGCAKKVSKQFIIKNQTIDEYYDELEQYNKEVDSEE